MYIRSTVPELEFGAGTREARVTVADKITLRRRTVSTSVHSIITQNAHPLLRCLDELASSTLAVPHVRTSEASVRNAREGRAGLEEVGVGTHEDVGHHGTRARTRGEYTAGINAIVLNSVAHHGSDSEGIASLVVREGRRAVNVPASSRVGRIGVDDNEAVRISEVGVLGTLKVRLGGTRAVMHGDDERWWVGQLRRLVDEHLYAGWVGAEVGDLLELASCGKRADS